MVLKYVFGIGFFFYVINLSGTHILNVKTQRFTVTVKALDRCKGLVKCGERCIAQEENGDEGEMRKMTASEFQGILCRAIEGRGQIQEVRLRTGQPVLLRLDGSEWFLRKDSSLGASAEMRMCGHSFDGVIADRTLVRDVLEQVSRHSLYAFEEEIRQGFLTMEGGHRIGLVGRAVLEGEKVRTLKDISGLNIRVAHEQIGCADSILGHLYENGTLCNTLFISPPGAGKTTMLRDVIRQVSNGNRFGAGQSVSVVDERSELAACVRGIPQCDLGIRTDVMDGCPKVEGMLRVLRSMAPDVIAVDEIGTREDMQALRDVMKCGCRILATVHGDSVEELRKKPLFCELLRENAFGRYVVLSARPRPGTVVRMFKEKTGGE